MAGASRSVACAQLRRRSLDHDRLLGTRPAQRPTRRAGLAAGLNQALGGGESRQHHGRHDEVGDEERPEAGVRERRARAQHAQVGDTGSDVPHARRDCEHPAGRCSDGEPDRSTQGQQCEQRWPQRRRRGHDNGLRHRQLEDTALRDCREVGEAQRRAGQQRKRERRQDSAAVALHDSIHTRTLAPAVNPAVPPGGRVPAVRARTLGEAVEIRDRRPSLGRERGTMTRARTPVRGADRRTP